MAVCSALKKASDDFAGDLRSKYASSKEKRLSGDLKTHRLEII